MRKVYVVLAWIVAIGVAVQAAALAFGVGGMVHHVQGGGVIDAGILAPGDRPSAFVGEIGFPIHGIVGGMVIPLAAILLLIASFFVKVPRARVWAAAVFVAVALQALAGYSLTDVPYLGLFHGANALVLLVLALIAARNATRRTSAPQDATPSPRETGNVRV